MPGAPTQNHGALTLRGLGGPDDAAANLLHVPAVCGAEPGHSLFAEGFGVIEQLRHLSLRLRREDPEGGR